MIYRNKDAINSFIDGYIPKGEQIKTLYCYWSSTVRSSYVSWYVYMIGGYSNGIYSRLDSGRVRAVALAK